MDDFRQLDQDLSTMFLLIDRGEITGKEVKKLTSLMRVELARMQRTSNKLASKIDKISKMLEAL